MEAQRQSSWQVRRCNNLATDGAGREQAAADWSGGPQPELFILFNMLAGNMQHVMPGSVGFVDVSDVAKAHVLAAKVPKAGGERYLCSGVTKTWLEIVDMLRAICPAAPLPTACPDGSTTQPCLQLRNEKIKADLGMEFVPLHHTLQAQCNALQQAGLISL